MRAHENVPESTLKYGLNVLTYVGFLKPTAKSCIFVEVSILTNSLEIV